MSGDALSAISGVFGLAGAGAALIACALAARGATPRQRASWLLMAVAAGTWAIGALWWFVAGAGHVSDGEAAVWSLAALVAAASLALSPGAPRDAPGAGRTMVDGLIVGASALFVACALGLDDLYSGTGTRGGLILAAAVAQLVVAAAAVVMLTRSKPGPRPALWRLAGGLGGLAIGAGAVTYLALGGATDAVKVVLLGWGCGWLLIAAATRVRAPTPEAEDVVPGLPTQASVFIPSFPFAISVAIGAVAAVRGDFTDFMIWNAAAVVILIVARQILALLENIAFWRRLEANVESRTDEITALAEERGELAAQVAMAEEATRRGIAQALHDDVLQRLLAARQELLRHDAARDAMARALEAVDGTVERLRAAVLALHPVTLEHGDLKLALDATARDAAERGGFRHTVRVESEAIGAEDRLVLAAARELLDNVAKHARASRCSVSVWREDGHLILEVADDGAGIPPDRPRIALREGHVGLASMTQRLHALGGGLELNGRSGGGTLARAMIPVRAA
jgi:signal transduction histidine kinase